MDNKRLIIILMIFTIIFTIMGGTFAYYNWQSADNKKTNVTFTVNRNYTCGADSGGHITSSDIRLAPAKCNDPVYAIKRTIVPSVTATGDKVVSMDLWLNINSIDTNLTNTPNFKWVFSKNVNTCESGIISQGDFRNIQNGKIDLLSGAEYANNESDKYYLYIWLDESETNTNTMNQSFDFSVGGNCVDNGLEKALLKNLNTTDYFREADYKTKITDISFIYDEDLPSGIITNNVKTYDLGASASKPITGYLIENTDQGADPDTYKLYVSSKYKIYAQSLANAFNGMTALKNISFDNFDTSLTTNMNSMFNGCSSLLALDLRGFNTSKVTIMNAHDGGTTGMFKDCSSLTELDLSYFDTSLITQMPRMFYGCSNLTLLDISSFDTSNVTNMSVMFNGCSSLTELDLSNFDVSKMTANTTNRSFYQMFHSCSKLQTIYVSDLWKPNSSAYSVNMFRNCSKLVGGAGTKYNSNYTDKTYARIDNPPDSPGYFTYKAYIPPSSGS